MSNSPDMAQSSGLAGNLYSTIQTAENFREMHEQLATMTTAIEIIKRQQKSFVQAVNMESLMEVFKNEAKQEAKLEMMKIKKELMNENQTLKDEMKRLNDEALSEAKLEINNALTTAMRKLKAECIEMVAQQSVTIIHEVKESIDATDTSLNKAIHNATAKNKTDAEDYTDFKIVELVSDHTAFQETTNKKTEAMSKRFLGLFEEVTEKFISFTLEHQIQAQQSKLQMADRLQGREMRPPSRGDDRHSEQAHAIEFTSRQNYSGPRRQDIGGEEAMRGHAELRVEAEMFLMRDDREFERLKQSDEQMRTNQMRLIQDNTRSGENFVGGRSFIESVPQRLSGPRLTHHAVEQHGSQYQGAAGGRAQSVRSFIGDNSNV